MRIVSLLPSATEIVAALGLADALVGVTHECDHPPAVRDLPRVTITHIPTDADSAEIDRLVRAQLTSPTRALYSLDEAALAALRPDLIVTQTLCDVCAVSDHEVREAMAKLPHGAQVIYLEPTTLGDVLASLRTVADAAQAGELAAPAIAALEARIHAVRQRADAVIAKRGGRMRVVVLEWLDPLFTSGHWTPELVEIAGGTEPLATAGQRSRQTTAAEVAAARPDMLVIACCGFGAARAAEDMPRLLAHPEVAALPCVRAGRVFIVDGSAYFSRPGPRLVDSLEILAELIQNDPPTVRSDVIAWRPS